MNAVNVLVGYDNVKTLSYCRALDSHELFLHEMMNKSYLVWHPFTTSILKWTCFLPNPIVLVLYHILYGFSRLFAF